MAFEVIFGENAKSCSSDVYNKLLTLRSPCDIDGFCEEVRTRAGGGFKACEERRKQIKALEEKAHAYMHHRFGEVGYEALLAQLDLVGQNYRLLYIASKAATSIGRYEDAILFARMAAQHYEAPPNTAYIVEELCGIPYAGLGYANSLVFKYFRNARPSPRDIPDDCEPEKAFDDNDYKMAFEAVGRMKFSIYAEDSFEKRAFPLCHLSVHEKYRSGPKLALETARNFQLMLEALSKNESFQELISELDIGKLEGGQLRLFGFFLMVIAQYVENAKIKTLLLETPWFLPMLKRVGKTMLSRDGISLIARFEPGSCCDILMGYQGLSSLASDGYFNFRQICNTAAFFTYGGLKFLRTPSPFGAPNFFSINFVTLPLLLPSAMALPGVRGQFDTYSKDELNRDLDLFLTMIFANFLEWKDDFFSELSLKENLKVPKVTSASIVTQSLSFFLNLIDQHEKTARVLADHTNLFIFLVHALDSLNVKNASLLSNAGVELVDKAVRLIASLCKRSTILGQLAGNQPFVKRLIPFLETALPRNPSNASDLFEIIERFLLNGTKTYFAKLLYKRGDSVVTKCILGTCSPNRILVALVLKGADVECRRRWFKLYAGKPIFSRIGSKLLSLAAESQRIDESMKVWIGIYALFCGTAQLASFDNVAVDNVVLKKFLAKLLHATGKNREISIFIGVLVGDLAKASWRFRNLLRQNVETHFTITACLKDQLEKS